jgi:hypothetical protein
MTDIKSPTLLYAKGFLMLAVGTLASILLLIDRFDIRSAVLLAVTVWGFCRAYYFAFYVIEHYVDHTYRFAGLIDFVKYSVNRGSRPSRHDAQ